LLPVSLNLGAQLIEDLDLAIRRDWPESSA
jgi:hypothetical protein